MTPKIRSCNGEEATLLNPAFCSALLCSTAAGWQEVGTTNFPFVYSFLVLPIVLHKQTRKILPRTTRTSLPNWIQENPTAKVGFYERAISLKPFTQRAILFGSSNGQINVYKDGSLHTDLSTKVCNNWSKTLGGEAGECISRATFLGKWLNMNSAIETVLPLWGITI